jgi:hypothetical protein
MVFHIHFLLCEVIRVAICVDQLDVSNLECFELLIRRLITDEVAVARNPRHPDYGGLELLMSTTVSQSGQALPKKFNEWFASRLKDRANVMRQTRLWNEEAGQAAKSQGPWVPKGDKGEGEGGKAERAKKDKKKKKADEEEE